MKISVPFTADNKTWVVVSELFPKDLRTFAIRFIPADKTTLGEDLLIASDDFESVLRNPELDWNDEHEGFWHKPMFGLSANEVERICREIYDHIFFFTDYVTFQYSDELLLCDMKRENPTFFK